jgi:hypothetical protein
MHQKESDSATPPHQRTHLSREKRKSKKGTKIAKQYEKASVWKSKFEICYPKIAYQYKRNIRIFVISNLSYTKP